MNNIFIWYTYFFLCRFPALSSGHSKDKHNQFSPVAHHSPAGCFLISKRDRMKLDMRLTCISISADNYDSTDVKLYLEPVGVAPPEYEAKTEATV